MVIVQVWHFSVPYVPDPSFQKIDVFLCSEFVLLGLGKNVWTREDLYSPVAKVTEV